MSHVLFQQINSDVLYPIKNNTFLFVSILLLVEMFSTETTCFFIVSTLLICLWDVFNYLFIVLLFWFVGGVCVCFSLSLSLGSTVTHYTLHIFQMVSWWKRHPLHITHFPGSLLLKMVTHYTFSRCSLTQNCHPLHILHFSGLSNLFKIVLLLPSELVEKNASGQFRVFRISISE